VLRRRAKAVANVTLRQGCRVTEIVRVADDNHVTGGASLPPLVDPLIIDMMEVDVRQERADGSLNAKDNFQFERTIIGFRGRNVVDLRRKR